ncbi:pyruvate ferredoxin oxidoreductase [Clostridium fermenticellae]|uniref:Pyruvate ferredoxin oxidoreductase n=1 Tax=Clostridium fermenticellae TaxID=2068654 RepID=A0A386H4D5_9CLOT|nr:transketolase C-terminal domain-containing protein [Clostridium fermenticellae]AYD40526.1 pyruvate ferredoxin oxidoreductase [Clostridium fermenticellae]
MSNKQFISGDEAVAVGAKLAKPQVISAYPITPQTIVVERLSDFVEDGSLNSEYLYVESEHSAMSSCIGASSVGARTFTATSSQGLLYMCECLHYASGSRLPIVMMNANRSTATPWNIYGDQRDSLSQLESGWIQFYVEDAQEALDTVIQAYRIAEDPEVMTPVMINLDGFVLTHTYELVDIPEQIDVDSFIPYQDYVNKMDIDNPKSTCFTAGPDWNTEFRYQQNCAMLSAIEKIRCTDAEFEKKFGRSYGGLVEDYKCDGADVILVTLGSVTGTARIVVDEMNKNGQKVGLLKLRCIRPFPKKEVVDILRNAKAVGVLEKDISFGYEGAVFSDLNSSLTTLDKVPKTYNFIGGLGGRDISKGDIKEIFEKLLQKSNKNKTDNVEFIKLRCENYGC